MVGLMVNSKTVYAKGALPMPPSLWWAPCDPHLCRRPSNTSRAFCFSLLWGPCSSPLGLHVHKIVWVCPSRLESLFPSVFWKAYNQSHWCSKPDSLGIPSPFVRSPGWKAWHVVQNFHNSERTSLVLLFSSLRVNHLAGVGFDLIMIVPLLPSCWSFFVFGCEVSFLWVPVSSCQ